MVIVDSIGGVFLISQTFNPFSPMKQTPGIKNRRPLQYLQYQVPTDIVNRLVLNPGTRENRSSNSLIENDFTTVSAHI